MHAMHLRFFSIVVLLGTAAAFLNVWSAVEKIPRSEDLHSFPLQFGRWQGAEQTIPQNYFDVLGPGKFLSRIYRKDLSTPPTDLFIGYFPSQRTGDTIHSPKNCLPGSGWAPVESSQVELDFGPRNRFWVNRYVIERSGSRQLVLYWYQAHGRKVASEYWAKFYLVVDAIHRNRTDGALVRLITPMAPGEDTAAAFARLSGLARLLEPELPRFIPD